MPAAALFAQQNLVPIDIDKMASDLIKLMSRIPIRVKEQLSGSTRESWSMSLQPYCEEKDEVCHYVQQNCGWDH